MITIDWDSYTYSPTVICVGATGMLGRALMTVLEQVGWDVVGLSSQDIDITDRDSIDQAFSLYAGDVVVINAAAYTAVDECERYPDIADAVNGSGPGYLATACRTNGWRLVHISTDYVFSGTQFQPYTEEDVPSPINVYGSSKWAGERAIQHATHDYVIFRLQWLFGDHGQHFVGTMLKLAQERAAIQVVNDQFGSPSWVAHLAPAIVASIAAQVPSGIYHLANMGYASWYELCNVLQDIKQLDTVFEPVDSSQFVRPATRPLNSRLDISKFLRLNLVTLPSWQTAIREYLNVT